MINLNKGDDFVILMECMDESGEIGIVIEDGEIKKNNYKG
jgi:hypothetical protein